jgi:two-component sensor histidine kinase
LTSLKEDTLEAENSALRELLDQAGLDASRLLEQAGINATERDAAERLQRLLLEELHHRVKNTLTTVMAIASQSLRHATDLEQGRESISHRLIALGRAHDLLLQSNWTSASLPAIVRTAIEPFDISSATLTEWTKCPYFDTHQRAPALWIIEAASSFGERLLYRSCG